MLLTHCGFHFRKQIQDSVLIFNHISKYLAIVMNLCLENNNLYKAGSTLMSIWVVVGSEVQVVNPCHPLSDGSEGLYGFRFFHLHFLFVA